MISLIAAVSNNGVIGNDLNIPWYISDDLKRFKAITSNHHVIMGRKTFESLKCTPLPGRINIVVSKTLSSTKNIIIANSFPKALAKACYDSEIFIIGGGQIYNNAINIAGRIYLTKVYENIEGNVFFPEIDPNLWHIKQYEGTYVDPKSKLTYGYFIYEKN